MINPPPSKKPFPWPVNSNHALDECYDLLDQLDDVGDPDVDELFNYAQRAAAESID